MNNKHFITFLLMGLCSVMHFSCVDDRYDLANKEISTDIKITDNTVAVPLGSMKAVALDDLIDVDDIDILKKDGKGLYSISTDDAIDPIEETIDPITISIDPVEELINIDFTEAEITTVHIEAANIEPAVFETPSISLEELNDRLPVLRSDVTREISSSNLDDFFALLESGNVSSLPAEIPFNQQVSIDNESVDASFNYTLPSQVKTINTIQLTTIENNDPNGTLISVEITHPAALANIDKRIDFDITFPEIFVLAENPAVDQAGKYTLAADGHSISVNGLTATGGKSTISFYLTKLINVDSKISNGVINVNDDIVYNLKYDVEGTIIPSDQLTRDDFKFNVAIDVPLAFSDASGETNDIEVDFEKIEMDFHGHFDNLQYIDMIYYIEFDEDFSRIKFETHMDKEWLNFFNLKDGYALRLSFPEALEICPIHSEYEGKGTSIVYDEVEHAFYVYDLKVLANSHWDLHLKKFTLNAPVVNGEYDLDVFANIEFVDPEKQPVSKFTLAGAELESMVSTFNSLQGKKEADFVMSESDLTIVDAVVHTEAIISELDTESEFDLNEEVPSEITCIEALDFTDEVVMRFDLSIEGLKDLNTDIDLDVHATLPSFINVTPSATSHSDMTVECKPGELIVKAQYHPGRDENMWIELSCDGLDFRTPEFGGKGIVPEIGADGKAHIVYSDKIVVEGDASIRGTEFHSYVLENMDNICLDIDLTMSDMSVKTFHGTYEGEIDGINETIDLDLGDDLAFLKEEGNTIELAEPQFEIVLDNSIGVPVEVDLQISRADENGVIIHDSEIIKTISIKPASYNAETGKLTPESTKLFITCAENLEPKVGYEKVLIPELATFLQPIPDQINISLQPRIDTSVTHHVDISKPLTFTGSYAVNVPLKFNNFNLTYRETITDLQGSIGDALDMFTIKSARAKLNILNTIPLGLTLQVTPLDTDGNVIADLHIDDLQIKPGLGGNIVNADGTVSEQEAQTLEFEITSASGDFSALDKLDLVITAATNHIAGSVGINANQGIKISDVVIEVKADFETDFND